MVVNRTKRDRLTDPTFSAIAYSIADLESQVNGMNDAMGMMTNTSVVIPEPGSPFKVAERTDADGKFFVTVVINIPTNVQCDEIRVILIRKSRNAILSSDADSAAAKARAQKETKATTFRIEVDEDQFAAGVVEAEIGPITPKKSDSDQTYQLIRLITVSTASTGTVAVGKNPADNPFSGTTFPFAALAEFTVGDGVSGCGKPSLARIVVNEVNLSTQASDARVELKIPASEDETKTFEEQGINQVTAVLRRYADGTDETVDAGKRNITIPVEIEDPSAKFVIAVRDFDLADRFRWIKNRAKSNVSPKPVVATPASEVSFYAGGTLPTNGIPELTTAPVFTFTVISPDQAELKLVLTQPNPAVLLKRLVFEKERTAGSGSWRQVAPPIVLLQEESALSPTTPQNPAKEYTVETQVKKNQSAINFRARLVGVGHTAAAPIERIITQTGVNTITAPATPVLADIDSVPDDSTNTAEAKTNITVKTQGGATFRTLGVDHVGCIIRKQKASGGGTQDDVDDLMDSKLRTYSRPLDDGELDLTSASINVPGLQFDKRYVLKKTLFEASGQVIKSAAAALVFIAGNKSSVGLSALTLFAPTRVRNDERHSDITCRYDQPAAGQAALVTSMVLFRKRPTDADFIKVEPPADFKSNPDYSSNTSGTAPNTATQKYATFTVQHKKNVGDGTAANSLRYKYRLRDGNGNSVDSPIFTDTNTGSGGPTDLPSFPTAADVTTGLDTDNPDLAVTTVRVYAEWNKTKTFRQVEADRAFTVIVNANAPATASGQIKDRQLSPSELDQLYVDIRIEDLKKGRRYKCRMNGTSKDGIAVLSQMSDVMFTHGVNNENFAAVTLTLALSPVDDRVSKGIVTIAQPTTASGIPAQPLRKLFLERALPPPPPGRSWSTALQRVGGAVQLQDDPEISKVDQSKDFQFDISHPRGIVSPQVITVVATLVSDVDGSKRTDTKTITPGEEDLGTPQWVNRTPDPKTKWKGDSVTGILRFKFRLPDTNLRVHLTTKITVVIISNGNTYYWDPTDDNPRDTTSYLKNMTPSFNDTKFYVEFGPVSSIPIPVDRPSNSVQGDLPLEIWNDLKAAGGSLTITAYVFNPLTTSAATAGVTSDDISWVF